MAACLRTSRFAAIGLLVLLTMNLAAGTRRAYAQQPAPAKAADAVPSAPASSIATQPYATADRPLPDIPTLMRDVEANQRRSEAIQKDYIFHSVLTRQETDGQGQPKKTTVEEYDTYWANGVSVGRLMKKNGKDLTAEEIAKENERIDKETAKAHEKREQADAEGKETDSRGDEEITVSRLLELGSFSNARRVQLNGRDTIAIDYVGDPKAKTRNRGEEVIRDMQGTAWIDEQDHVLVRVDGHFVNAFKIFGGLIADVQKGTSFSMEQTKVNGEVWLRSRVDAQGAARTLLFFSFSGNFHVVDSDYRKFRTSATVLPGFTGEESGKPPIK
jgi:hypothetical protein